MNHQIKFHLPSRGRSIVVSNVLPSKF